MTKKTYDLAVKIGEKNWLNVGAVLEKDDGGRFMLLNRSFNPAGVPFKEGSETIMVSMFSVKSGEQNEEKSAPSDGDISF